MGILEKHAADNFFDRKWWQFEEQLEQGRIPIGGIPGGMLIRTACPDCDTGTMAIRYRGRRILIDPGAKTWDMHQCPYQMDVDDNDEPQRDGDGELV